MLFNTSCHVEFHLKLFYEIIIRIVNKRDFLKTMCWEFEYIFSNFSIDLKRKRLVQSDSKHNLIKSIMLKRLISMAQIEIDFNSLLNS